MIEIYGFPEDVVRCPNCMKCKKLCDDNNLDYVFHKVVTGIDGGKFIRDIAVCKELMHRLNSDSDTIPVPKVFVDGQYIGGFYDLKNYHKSLQEKS